MTFFSNIQTIVHHLQGLTAVTVYSTLPTILNIKQFGKCFDLKWLKLDDVLLFILFALPCFN